MITRLDDDSIQNVSYIPVVDKQNVTLSGVRIRTTDRHPVFCQAKFPPSSHPNIPKNKRNVYNSHRKPISWSISNSRLSTSDVPRLIITPLTQVCTLPSILRAETTPTNNISRAPRTRNISPNTLAVLEELGSPPVAINTGIFLHKPARCSELVMAEGSKLEYRWQFVKFRNKKSFQLLLYCVAFVFCDLAIAVVKHIVINVIRV